MLGTLLRAEPIDADLLVVGGSESACAAAVQAARLGVGRVVLVNDIDWLGGQFSAEGVGCLDEWTTVKGKRVNFPRSGLFLEVVERMRAHNSARYGVPAPGNAFCGTETIEPAAAARISAGPSRCTSTRSTACWPRVRHCITWSAASITRTASAWSG